MGLSPTTPLLLQGTHVLQWVAWILVHLHGPAEHTGDSMVPLSPPVDQSYGFNTHLHLHTFTKGDQVSQIPTCHSFQKPQRMAQREDAEEETPEQLTGNVDINNLVLTK